MILASRYTYHLAVLQDKNIVAQGEPSDIMNADLARHVFQSANINDPLFGTLYNYTSREGRKKRDEKITHTRAK